MTKDLTTMRSNQYLNQAYRLFQENNFHHLPIVNDQNQVIGILSSTDMDRLEVGSSLFKHQKKDEYNEAFFSITPIQKVMTDVVICVEPTDDIRLAYRIFRKNRIHALPVIKDDILVGMVTPLDLLEYLFEEN